MGVTDGLRQRRTRPRHGQQMDVVGHQTPSPYVKLVFRGVFREQIQVDAAVFCVVEYDLTRIAALRDVVRNTRRDHSCDSRHLKESVGSDAGKSPRKSGNGYPVTTFFLFVAEGRYWLDLGRSQGWH